MIKIKKIMACVLMLGVVFSTLFTATAETTYNSYTYWVNGEERIAVPNRHTYEVYATVYAEESSAKPLSEASDITTDIEGDLYIADTGNSRIVVMDKHGVYKKEITSVTYDGEVSNLNQPKGVSIDTNGKLYIADSLNARVVICDIDGLVERFIYLPSSSLIPDDYEFVPVKVAVDSQGYVYILSSGSYYGALLFSPEGEFISFYGANTVQGTLTSALTLMWETLFPNDEKKAATIKQLPYQFNDLCIFEDFVFTVTGLTDVTKNNSSKGQVKKLSPGGSNVLKSKTGIESVSSNEVSFQDEGYYRGILYTSNRLGNLETDFSSICVSDGIIYLLDQSYGKIFVYDQECNALNIFGTGLQAGDQEGTFCTPSALTVFDDKLYVLDAKKNNITVFKITEYGELLLEAQKLSISGEYEDALPIWEKVLELDSNCQLAYRGLGNAYYSLGDFEQSQKYAKIAKDRNTYALAKQQIRNDNLSENFTIVFSLALLLLAALTVALILKKKRNIVLIKKQSVKTALRLCLHPFDTFQNIKYKKYGSVVISGFLIAIFYVSTVIKEMYSGFAFSTFEPSTYNSIITLLRTVGIVALWIIVNWAICSLMDGKGSLNEVYIITGYSLIPLIASNFITLIMTHILLPTEGSFITIVSVVCMLYTLYLLIVGTMIAHEYDFFKFLGTTVVVIVAIALVIFIIFLLCILFQQATEFISTVFKEISMR